MSESAPEGATPPASDDDDQRAGLKTLVKDLLGMNRAALAILVAVPVMLTFLDYYGMPWHYPDHGVRRPMHRHWQMRRMKPPLYEEFVQDLDVPGSPRIKHYMWWGICCLLFLVFLPMLVGWFFGRQSPRDLGLKVKGTGRDAWTYFLLFIMFFPIIYAISRTPEFQATYPFFKPTDGKLDTDFFIFEVIYCLQFFAVEFFFRGFIVLGLKKALGWGSVLVSLAPYCMIHYYKPMPEAMGAIGAGLVLGALSWRTGTIVYGWALHYAVALSMDLLALKHLGLI